MSAPTVQDHQLAKLADLVRDLSASLVTYLDAETGDTPATPRDKMRLLAAVASVHWNAEQLRAEMGP